MARPRQNNRVFELGVMMLIYELMNAGFSTIPPVTLCTIVAQALLYTGILDAPWNKWDVCISSEKVLSAYEFRRLFLSTVEHADDLHLYYNMISYLVKGRSLENRYGSSNFAFLLMILTFLTSVGYVALGYACAALLSNDYYTKVCAIGFSGVIFALKVVTSSEDPPSTTSLQGILVSTRYAAWVELILIHLLVPRASFMGHLAGILAGLVYTCTPCRSLIDNTITSITGEPLIHGPSFYNNDEPEYRAADNEYEY